MDSLAIQRSLTILEERYRELREMGEKRFQAWEEQESHHKAQLKVSRDEQEALNAELKLARDDQEALSAELKLARDDQEALSAELKDSQEEAELRLLQLHQVQEELEHYFLESQSANHRAAQAEALTSRALNQANEREQQLHSIRSSTSWRISAPIRWTLEQCHTVRREGIIRRTKVLTNKIAITGKRLQKNPIAQSD